MFDHQLLPHSPKHPHSHSRPKITAETQRRREMPNALFPLCVSAPLRLKRAPATWTVWLGCVGRAPEGQPPPCGASPFTSCTPCFPPSRNCICIWGVAGGVLPPCIRVLKRKNKNHPIQTNSQKTKTLPNSSPKTSPKTIHSTLHQYVKSRPTNSLVLSTSSTNRGINLSLTSAEIFEGL